MNPHSEKFYYPDGTTRIVKARWPIPRETYPDPDQMAANEKTLQGVLSHLEEMVDKSNDVDELEQIAELAQMAFDVAFWQRKRADAAVKKFIREAA